MSGGDGGWTAGAGDEGADHAGHCHHRQHQARGQGGRELHTQV